MSGAVATMARESAVIRCPDCGGTREISVRQKRRIKNGNLSLLCPLCRTIPFAAVTTPADLAWWLERRDIEWVKETAAMIWNDE